LGGAAPAAALGFALEALRMGFLTFAPTRGDFRLAMAQKVLEELRALKSTASIADASP
jgi:hypothetical protein